MKTAIVIILICFSSFMTGIAYGASNDEILSQHIKEADGTSGQDTNTGSGIKTGHIQKGAVTTGKIRNLAVTNSKIADGAVTNTKIAIGAITPDKIGFYGNVAIVAPTGGDYTEPVTAMNNVSSWCGTPSATNPCLLKIMPGVYNIGSGSIQMQSYVDIEGSGENTTKIIGNIQGYSTGVVRGASNAEIRYLTIENHGTSGFIRGIYNSGASPTISNVTLNVSGATTNPQGYAENRGIVNENNSMPLIKDVTINASGIHACGILSDNSSPTIKNTTIYVSQSFHSYYISGIESLGNCSLTIRDTTVDVSGGTDAIGIYLRYGSASISNTSVTVQGGSVSNTGVSYSSDVIPYIVTIDNSRIHGDTYSIANRNNYTTKVGASKLEGPLYNEAGGTLICAGVYNANYQFFANTCP